MPPYKPYASRAQQRKLHAMANRGEIAESEVRGKDDATDFSHLPARKGKRKEPKHKSIRALHRIARTGD